MEGIITVFDTIVCICWIVTYTLVLVGSIKYKYPLISPITQAIIAPFEIASLFLLLRSGAGFNYAFFAYLYWAVIEIAIFRVIEYLGYIEKKYVTLYICLVAVIMASMLYYVVFKGEMFLFSYLNTFVGMLFWLRFIQNQNYPMKAITLAVFVTKFLGDFIAIPVYFGKGPLLINMICILLPVCDFLFILIFFSRNKKISGKCSI